MQLGQRESPRRIRRSAMYPAIQLDSVGTSGDASKHGHWLPKVEVCNVLRKAIDSLLKVYQIDEFRSIWSVGCFPRACEVGWGENERTSQPQMLCWTYFSTSDVVDVLVNFRCCIQQFNWDESRPIQTWSSVSKRFAVCSERLTILY